MESSDPVDTPMVERTKLDEDPQGIPVDSTRIAERLTEKHLTTVKRIFRYLKGTINMALWHPKDIVIELTTYADADHAGCQNTIRSTAGSAQLIFLVESMAQENQQQDRHDEELVPISEQVRIGLSNYRTALEKQQPELIYQICLAILNQCSFFNAFTETADEHLKYGMEIPEEMMSDTIKESADYLNYMAKSTNTQSGKETEATEEEHWLNERQSGLVIGRERTKGLGEGSSVVLEKPDDESDCSISSYPESDNEVEMISDDDERTETNGSEKTVDKEAEEEKVEDEKAGDKKAEDEKAREEQVVYDQAGNEKKLEKYKLKFSPKSQPPQSKTKIIIKKPKQSEEKVDVEVVLKRLTKFEKKVKPMSKIDHTEKLYDDLMDSLLVDEDDMDKQYKVQPTQKKSHHDDKEDHKKDDKDKQKRRRKVSDASKSQKDKTPAKSSKEDKAPSEPSKTDKAVDANESIQDYVMNAKESMQDDVVDVEDPTQDEKLYDDLMDSLLVDEDDMDKQYKVQPTQKKSHHDDKEDHKKDDKDKQKRRRKVSDASKSQKDKTPAKSSKEDKAPSEPSKTDKAVDANESIQDYVMNAKESMQDDVVDVEDPTQDEEPNVNDAPKQNWFKMVNAEKDPKEFHDLMGSTIDFTKLAKKCLKKDKLKKENLEGPAYTLLKGNFKNIIELGYNMKQCYLAMTDQIDWANPKGGRCPYDLSKTLPLQGSPDHKTIPVDFFFNKYLEYLKTGNKEKKYVISRTKPKATRYDLEGLEEMIPKL
nr:hypothetical protein [Tanacetum cinerariifolium]